MSTDETVDEAPVIPDLRMTMKQLEEATGQPARNIRYLIAKGIVPEPVGETRWAHYGEEHVRAVSVYLETKQASRPEAIRARIEMASAPPVVPTIYEVAPGVTLSVLPGALEHIEQFLEQVRSLAATTQAGETK